MRTIPTEAKARLKARGQLAPGAARCRRKFLRFFPEGFRDADYVETERDYKHQTHLRWREVLSRTEFARLLDARKFEEIAARAVRVEQSSRYSMLFSFEKMALRDAVRSASGAQTFATGLFDFLHGEDELEARFIRWVEAVERLPRKQTRVLTWPVVTVFGFIAQPTQHIFLKPLTLRAAAKRYGFDFAYRSRPNWETYASLLAFAEQIRSDVHDLGPRDMIDLQSFMWVQGSDEYAE